MSALASAIDAADISDHICRSFSILLLSTMSQWHLCAMCIGLTLVGPRYTPQVGKIAITRQVTAIVIGLSIVFGSQ